MDQLEAKLDSLLKKKQYDEVVAELRKIADIEARDKLCYQLVAMLGTGIAADRFGQVRVIEDIEEYAKIKRGEGRYPAESVLFGNGKRIVKGLEDMAKLVPDENPLKQFYYEIGGD